MVLMSFWRRSVASQENSALILYVHDGSLYAVRGVKVPAAGTWQVAGETVVRIGDTALLLQLLRERLAWREGQCVFATGPMPPLVGRGVSVTVPRFEAGHVVVRDTRELLHHAHWQAVDTVRDLACTFFGCSLEDVDVVSTAVEQWRESPAGVAVTLFPLCGPQARVSAYSPELLDALGARPAFLPLLLSRMVGDGETPEGVLHVEDEAVTLVVRRGRALLHLRTLRYGVDDIRRAVERGVGCTVSESEALLALAADGRLSVAGSRVVAQISRTLLPLWGGILEVLTDSLAPEERPRQLVVTGCFPSLVARLFCRPRIVLRTMGERCGVRALPHLHGDPHGIVSALRAAVTRLADPQPAVVGQFSVALGSLVSA